MITVHVAAAPAIGVQRCVLCGLVLADVARGPNPIYWPTSERVCLGDGPGYTLSAESNLGSNEVMCR